MGVIFNYFKISLPIYYNTTYVYRKEFLLNLFTIYKSSTKYCIIKPKHTIKG